MSRHAAAYAAAASCRYHAPCAKISFSDEYWSLITSATPYVPYAAAWLISRRHASYATLQERLSYAVITFFAMMRHATSLYAAATLSRRFLFRDIMRLRCLSLFFFAFHMMPCFAFRFLPSLRYAPLR